MATDHSTEWTRFEKANTEANRLNKTIVFEALSQAGITNVCVSFDGEGDQGQMERASAHAHGNEVEFPAVNVPIREAEHRSPELALREVNLQEAVEHLCYGYLEQQYGGWENNEGAFGEFLFDVAARTITLEYYGRIIETDYSSHTF